MIQNPSLRKAKKDGMSYEKQYELFCRTLGIASGQYSKTQSESKLFDDPNYLYKNVPYESIYDGSICTTEFVLKIKDKKIRIEFKSQNKAGSKDECIPYIFENAETQFPEDEFVLMIIGKGFRNGIKNYVNRKINNSKKNIKVFYELNDLKTYTKELL